VLRVAAAAVADEVCRRAMDLGEQKGKRKVVRQGGCRSESGANQGLIRGESGGELVGRRQQETDNTREKEKEKNPKKRSKNSRLQGVNQGLIRVIRGKSGVNQGRKIP